MNRRIRVAAMAVVAGVALISTGRSVSSHDRDHEDGDDSRIRRGFEISPVKLTYRHSNREWVGLGSYIVNAQSGCNDCHTCPSYAHGGNPYAGQKTLINGENYLAGGVGFGPFTSANITPDDTGRPAGLTFSDFLQVMHKGHNPQDPPGQILQVMPWPVFGNMTDHDLRAVYEFLRSLPQAKPGTCSGPGEPAP
jgi:hypothetical protein